LLEDAIERTGSQIVARVTRHSYETGLARVLDFADSYPPDPNDPPAVLLDLFNYSSYLHVAGSGSG
jgi:hypothetical protein